MAKRPRWTVKYTTFDGRAVARYFPGEASARSFYRRLFRRCDVAQQSVEVETFDAAVEALTIRRVRSAGAALTLLVHVGRRGPWRVACDVGTLRDYGRFRGALAAQTGALLPRREIGRHAWTALLRKAMDGGAE